ncbi:hypothetical protein AEAC466_13575 [Asticcacaulis sp. AC466]|uniref:hypothetical protein n=1 Tax=Asticcacaulis sp. AC466 TaxID=1282362 RepID=UPI0003C3CFD2|nr:hypothetical protein [Asticcacaulis sp. AC466]ESQ83276.1 hypothetical protein AEAC466_13575 [Asticcacaulis sp. AC466]
MASAKSPSQNPFDTNIDGLPTLVEQMLLHADTSDRLEPAIDLALFLARSRAGKHGVSRV